MKSYIAGVRPNHVDPGLSYLEDESARPGGKTAKIPQITTHREPIPNLRPRASGTVEDADTARIRGTADGAETTSTPRTLPRVNSLDALRGLLLMASVGVNSLVHTPASIGHHSWAGVNAIDLIFPVFVTMTGCGIAFAYRNGISSWPRLIRRVVVLFVLGLLYNALTTNLWDLATWRITGVLQLYAVIIAVVSLGHVWFRTWWAWLGITAALSIAYTAMTTFVAGACAGGTLTPECNPSLIDTTAPWFMHVYGQGTRGHDPEGMIATFGALISVSAGAAVGHAILRGHGRTDHPFFRKAALIGGVAAVLALMAVLCAAAPTIFGLESMPIMKRLWTSPFALSVAACVALALLVLHAVIDDPTTRLQRVATGVSYPLLALGKNSLLVYFGSHVVNSWMRLLPTPEDSLQSRLIPVFGGGPAAEFAIPAMMILIWTVIALILHRRRIYVRA